MNIKQLATNFDVLYRRVNDRSKVTEVMLAQLAERSEAEEKYHKALEKISGQMQNGGGDIDDLVKGVKIDLNQRAQYYKQFNVSYKHDVETSINELKTIQTQFKPLIQEVLKLDKEIKITFDKYERQKDKTLRACKDYEEAAITLEAQCWNKECNAEQRAKALHRLNQQLVYKQENESQLRQASTLYNNSVAQYGSQLTTGITSLQSFYGKLFAIAKDIVMKILVYEISKTRNLQYDSEQFFKEAEKYLDPQTDPLAPGPSSQIGIAKENYYKVNPQLNSSFLRNISDQISISHRLNTKRETASSQLIEHFDQFDLMLTNPQLIDDLKGVTINLIGKVNNKNKPKNPEDQQPAGVQSVVNKYKDQYGEATLLKVFSFIKYVIQMTQEQQIKGWKNIPVLENNNLDEIFDCKFYRELGTIIIESFRQAGCSNMSQYGFKNMVAFTSKLLEISQKEGELLLVKRIITMISTIYTLDQQEKRFFLQDSLISMAIWKQIDLWEGLIYTTIEAEIDKSALREGTQFSNEQIFKDKNVIYSNLLSLTLNMINFKVDKTEIKNVLTKYARVFQLFELQAQELLKFADNDGKIEPNSKVNSLSVLQTLYYQPQSNIQQGANVQKKVVIFDKKNPLGNTITVAKPTGTQVYFTADTPVKEQPSPAVQQPHQQSNQTPAQYPTIQQQSQAQPPQQQPPQQQPPQQQPPWQQPPQQQPPQQQPPQQAPQPQQQPPPQPSKTITTGNSPILQQVQTTSPQVTQEQDQPKIRYNQHPLEAPKPNFLKKLP